MTTWIKELKPGDKVIVLPSGLTRTQQLGEVVGRTPSGRVKVRCGTSGYLIVFAQDGLEYGGPIPGAGGRIMPCLAGDEARLRDERDHERLAARFGGMTWRDWQSFPLETLRAVRDLLAAPKEKA